VLKPQAALAIGPKAIDKKQKKGYKTKKIQNILPYRREGSMARGAFI